MCAICADELSVLLLICNYASQCSSMLCQHANQLKHVQFIIDLFQDIFSLLSQCPSKFNDFQSPSAFVLMQLVKLTIFNTY